MDIVDRSDVDRQNLAWYAAKLNERDEEISNLRTALQMAEAAIDLVHDQVRDDGATRDLTIEQIVAALNGAMEQVRAAIATAPQARGRKTEGQR